MALWLPIIVLFAVLVVDVANWFEHKRHLQLQADAAVLAAAQEVTFNGNGACTSGNYKTVAQNYGQTQFNAQIGGTPASNVHMLLASSTYFGQSSPVDKTVVSGDPCTSGMIDVKLTEANLPWFFGPTHIVPHINAHARVQFQQANKLSGLLPIAVYSSVVQQYPTQTVLKIESGGSQSGALNCDPNGPDGTNLALMLQFGCGPTYSVNPDPTGANCPGFNFVTQPQPWNCVGIFTGSKTGQVKKGLNARIEGGGNKCINPNNFPNYTSTDPRLIEVFQTTFTFSGSGQTIIPVTGFATFYLTGWDGDPCSGDPSPGKGAVEGYFVKYVAASSAGGGAGTLCSASATNLSTCVPVLTQ